MTSGIISINNINYASITDIVQNDLDNLAHNKSIYIYFSGKDYYNNDLADSQMSLSGPIRSNNKLHKGYLIRDRNRIVLVSTGVIE